jgi:hypothetical protein
MPPAAAQESRTLRCLPGQQMSAGFTQLQPSRAKFTVSLPHGSHCTASADTNAALTLAFASVFADSDSSSFFPSLAPPHTATPRCRYEPAPLPHAPLLRGPPQSGVAFSTFHMHELLADRPKGWNLGRESALLLDQVLTAAITG